MKILLLESSGNKNGSSNLLAASFIRGVLENGHDVMEYDVFRADIRPCFGCNSCGTNGPCVQKDAFETQLKGLIRETDMMVFVMPVYYYNWPAKLKGGGRPLLQLFRGAGGDAQEDGADLGGGGRGARSVRRGGGLLPQALRIHEL